MNIANTRSSVYDVLVSFFIGFVSGILFYLGIFWYVGIPAVAIGLLLLVVPKNKINLFRQMGVVPSNGFRRKYLALKYASLASGMMISQYLMMPSFVGS